MIALDATDRQLIEVDVSKFVAHPHLLALIPLVDILRIPLLPQVLIRCDIVHHLVEHRASEASKHREENKAPKNHDAIIDVYGPHEARDRLNFLLLLYNLSFLVLVS